MVSTPEQETLQGRALKLQTTIKGTFPLFTLTLRFDSFLLKFAFSNHFGKGACTNDVSREGEGGGTQILMLQGRLRDFSTTDWSKMLTWGEGSKIPKI